MPKHKHEKDLDPSEQAEKDRADQLAQRQAAEDEGNIAQVSSAPLHNYPDAKMPKAPERDIDDDITPEQPRSGTSATAKNQPGVEADETEE